MTPSAIFLSTSPEVLEVHRGNVARGRTAIREWTRFHEETGMEPAVVFHPGGAILPGVYPPQRDTAHQPPKGWFWDPARGLYAPAPNRHEPGDPGTKALDRLSTMEWTVDSLPGLTGPAAMGNVACLDGEDPVARTEIITTTRDGESAAIEIDGQVWLTLALDMADQATEDHWERSRRYLMEEALASLSLA